MERAATQGVFIDEGRASKAPTTRVAAQPPFYFMAHPERWLIESGRVLPHLGKLKVQGGMSGMGASRSGKVTRIGLAKGRMEERGWTIIPQDSIPPQDVADGWDTYLCSPDGRPSVTMSIYDEVYPDSTEQGVDTPRWVRFLEHQITTGVIPPCPVYVLKRMLEKATDSHLSCADKAHNLPSMVPQAKYWAGVISLLERELSKRNDAKKPVRKRPRKATDDG